MQENFVNGPLTGHLKREVVALFGAGRSLAMLALVAVLAGLAGPFGTYEAFGPFTRHLYWALVVAGTAAAGHVTGTAVEYTLGRRGWPAGPRLLAAALVAAVPVCGVVALVLLGFGAKPDGPDLVVLYVQCAAVVGGVAVFTFRRPAPAPVKTDDGPPRLTARLPSGKRGRLIRLAAQDHYVEVVTSAGTTLVPIRFRDAVAETAPEPGLQVHRSHWVALHAVVGRCRLNSRTALRLHDGSVVPVGRKYMSTVRERDIS